MNVYELDQFPEYQALRESTVADVEVFWGFNGTPKAAAWIPAEVTLFRESDFFEGTKPSDFPYLTPGVPVFTPRSLTAVKDLLEPHGEILPLRSEDGVFFAYNITRIVDCLDVANSQVSFFRDGVRIMDVKRYAFFPERIAGIPIFKIPQFPRSEVFVTDEFVQRVRDHGLTGFRFKLRWSSP